MPAARCLLSFPLLYASHNLKSIMLTFILFDIDGTLVSLDGAGSRSLNRAMEELQIQMMGLEVYQTENAGNSARELSEPVVDVLGHECNTFLEFFTVGLGIAPHLF